MTDLTVMVRCDAIARSRRGIYELPVEFPHHRHHYRHHYRHEFGFSTCMCLFNLPKSRTYLLTKINVPRHMNPYPQFHIYSISRFIDDPHTR